MTNILDEVTKNPSYARSKYPTQFEKMSFSQVTFFHFTICVMVCGGVLTCGRIQSITTQQARFLGKRRLSGTGYLASLVVVILHYTSMNVVVFARSAVGLHVATAECVCAFADKTTRFLC